ncbi:MAG TPA: ABC transporter ATP-binding protein [Pyrinomonadaceae bacterium]|jgi:lipopolysaccharide transport system ATP-binding protein|nr:ABC transporter ATP-binding protein [Pyrinomonadaceae bacterium]
MSRPIIKAAGLSKRYRIGGPGHTSLRDAIADAARAPLRGWRGQSASGNTVWALKDVSFEVAPGEVVGIIGRNGAGKSTLLKILSRITRPTTGRVALNGRVGSLLEVGTGFHSELTGRENIFLNGAVLGMTRREIESKFDEIVAFAETEQFLDTPVKHYSSGMTVRLAFAVAAHLEPEILIIDEVLAVGDIAFQKKCLGKMNEVARHGRTVLFVSHDISAVNGLCQRAILLHEGSLVMNGPTSEVTAHYLDTANKLYSPVSWINFRPGEGDEIRLLSAGIQQRGANTTAVDCRAPFSVSFEYEAKKLLPNSRFFILVRNAKGDVVFGTSDYDWPGEEIGNRRTGKFVSEVSVPEGLLKAGSYYGTIGADIKNERIIFAENDVFQFEVFESGDDTLAERHKRVGLIAPLLRWQTSEADSKPQD